VLSRFDTRIIDNFLSNYDQYRRPMRDQAESPTDIIIKDVLPFA
jgi:hypothetical protein